MPEAATEILRGWQAASLRLLSALPAREGRTRQCIAEYGRSRLWHYPASQACAQSREPVVLVYAMVNRPTVLDLLPDRSFIGRFLDAGHPVYLLEWGDPDDAGYNRGLHHFVCERMDALLMAATRHSQRPKLTLFGICQGGVLSLLYALQRPASVKALVLLVTPVDFQTPGCVLYQRVREVDTDLLENAWCLDGELLVQLFHSLQPMRNTVAKYLQLAEDCSNGEAVDEKVRVFQAMEAWIADCPDQPARFFQEFVRGFYKQNQLIRGEVEIGSHRVTAGDLNVPVLNVYGSRDHIVPADSSRALAGLVPADRYQELRVDTGHIGMFVSARALQIVPTHIQQWLESVS